VIRAAVRQDADFLAWVILTASRGHLARGWFDIALNQPEGRCLEFLKRLSITAAPSSFSVRSMATTIAGHSRTSRPCPAIAGAA